MPSQAELEAKREAAIKKKEEERQRKVEEIKAAKAAKAGERVRRESHATETANS